MGLTANSCSRPPRWRSAYGGHLPLVVVFVLSGLFNSPASADDSSLVSGARDAGHAIGMTFHEIAQGAKNFGLQIGHTAAQTGRQIGQGAAELGRNIGHAAKEGGREFGHAIKGGA